MNSNVGNSLAYPSQNPFASSKYYTQINVTQTISLCCNPQTDCIQVTSPCVDITKLKTIHTFIGTSYEGQSLSGKKSIIVGDINLSFVLTRSYCNSYQTTSYPKTIPFSTYIVIPSDLCDNSISWVEYYVEDQTGIIIDIDTVYISVSLLLSYHNCGM